MTFWDGTRWVRTPGHPLSPETLHRSSSRRARLRDLIATAVIVIGFASTLIPFALTSATGPALTLSPVSGTAGQKVGLTGSGFQPRLKVQVSWDGDPSGMPTAQVNQAGAFKTSFVVPVGAVGAHLVSVASVESAKKAKVMSTAEASVTFDVTAPVTDPGGATATPAPTGTPVPTATPTPTPTPTQTPGPTSTPTSTPTLSPTLSPTAAPTLAPTAAPTTAPSMSGSYLVIDRPALLALPTSGSAWASVKNAADAAATPNLCDQDNKADVNALAAGLVYARTGDAAYRSKVVDLLTAAMPTQVVGCTNAVLALGRQLGGYVMAADLAGYRDPAWVSWLTSIRTKDIGGQGRWYILRDTAGNSANNWGTFALVSLIAADRFLGDSASLARDWAIFSGYGVVNGWPFTETSSWSQSWSCPVGSSSILPIAIGPVGCTLGGGFDGNGAPVEDASRASFPSASTYIAESEQGYAVQALLLARAGYAAWTVNSAQVCRSFSFAERMNMLNSVSVATYVAWMGNHFCGLSLPTTTPTSGGRIFGFSDWLWPSR